MNGLLYFCRVGRSLWIAATILASGVAVAPGQGLKNVIPANQKPIFQVFPPATAEQSKIGTGKFIIFTREQVGTNWDFIAGAWECIPSHPEVPLTKRLEFCRTSWDADQLLNTLVRDDSDGMHTRFVKLQVDQGDRDYGVNLYDINYRTWEVRCLWQGKRLFAFGVMGDSIFCDSSDGWMVLGATSGKINRTVPFTPIDTDGEYWLVRKSGETNGCWSYDRLKKQFIAHFGPVEEDSAEFSQSTLSHDGKYRAWVLVPIPEGWRGGAITGRLLLQRGAGQEEVSVPIEMQARMGSGVPVLPQDIELKSSPDRVEFRARKSQNKKEDQVWAIDIATGKVNSRVERSRPVADDAPAVMDGVPVPDYLRKRVREFGHFGRTGLAPAFLLHLGLLKKEPEYPDCIAGVSRDGRHVLYCAKKGPLAGIYIYGDLLTKKTVRWKAPAGLDWRDAQEFVWAEVTH